MLYKDMLSSYQHNVKRFFTDYDTTPTGNNIYSIEDWRNRLDNVRGRDDNFIASCPCGQNHKHGDKHQSLSVAVGDTKPVVAYCHRGCSFDDIAEAAGLVYPDRPLPQRNGNGGKLVAKIADALPKPNPKPKPEKPPKEYTLIGRNRKYGRYIDDYEYKDESGVTQFVLVRYADLKTGEKILRYWTPVGDKWINQKLYQGRLLYNLNQLLNSPTEVCYITEGEKDCNRLMSELVLSITNGGAGKWVSEFNQYLKNRDIVICEDNDNAGRENTELLIRSLSGVASRIRVVRFDFMPEKSDVSDYLDQKGICFNDFLALVENAPEVEPVCTDPCKPEPNMRQTEFKKIQVDVEPVKLYNMDDVRAEMGRIIAQALGNGDAGLDIIKASTGSGKTYQTVKGLDYWQRGQRLKTGQTPNFIWISTMHAHAANLLELAVEEMHGRNDNNCTNVSMAAAAGRRGQSFAKLFCNRKENGCENRESSDWWAQWDKKGSKHIQVGHMNAPDLYLNHTVKAIVHDELDSASYTPQPVNFKPSDLLRIKGVEPKAAVLIDALLYAIKTTGNVSYSADADLLEVIAKKAKYGPVGAAMLSYRPIDKGDNHHMGYIDYTEFADYMAYVEPTEYTPIYSAWRIPTKNKIEGKPTAGKIKMMIHGRSAEFLDAVLMAVQHYNATGKGVDTCFAVGNVGNQRGMIFYPRPKIVETDESILTRPNILINATVDSEPVKTIFERPNFPVRIHNLPIGLHPDSEFKYILFGRSPWSATSLENPKTFKKWTKSIREVVNGLTGHVLLVTTGQQLKRLKPSLKDLIKADKITIVINNATNGLNDYENIPNVVLCNPMNPPIDDCIPLWRSQDGNSEGEPINRQGGMVEMNLIDKTGRGFTVPVWTAKDERIRDIHMHIRNAAHVQSIGRVRASEYPRTIIVMFPLPLDMGGVLPDEIIYKSTRAENAKANILAAAEKLLSEQGSFTKAELIRATGKDRKTIDKHLKTIAGELGLTSKPTGNKRQYQKDNTSESDT